MYEVYVAARFEAAHRLVGAFGPATRTHGHTYRIESSWRYVDQPMGAAVPVVYLAPAPDRGCVAHWTDLWLPVFLWAGVAVFFAVLDLWY